MRRWPMVQQGASSYKKTIDYLSARTLLRPRDMIAFMNECVHQAAGENKITAHTIKKAEEKYSDDRLHSLATEWQIIYPELLEVSQMFYGMHETFSVSDISEQWLQERYLEIFDSISQKNGPLAKLLDGLYSAKANFSSVRNSLIRELHVTGLFGIKTGPSSTVSWSHEGGRSISKGQLKPISKVYIHPMFYRTLGTKLAKKN